MGYMLPLRFIKVSQKTSGNEQFDVAICATRIVAIMSTETNQARRTIKEEKKAGTLINAAGRSATKSAIFLDNGSVVASPFSVNRLMSAIEKSNHKETDSKKPIQTVRLKVYDVVDEEPDPAFDIDIPEMDANVDQYDEEIQEDNDDVEIIEYTEGNLDDTN